MESQYSPRHSVGAVFDFIQSRDKKKKPYLSVLSVWTDQTLLRVCV